MKATRLVPWAFMAVVLAISLGVAARGQSGPLTDAQRVNHLTAEIRCPTCRGLSAAVSDAPPAKAIRDEVLRRVQGGQTDSEILGYVVSRYGKDILLKPEANGIAGLVWALPVVAVVCAVGGLALVFRRWRPSGAGAASEDDEALVEKALQP
ncbi:MAG: cytochrome c-type biogenesis protein CcmH [Actinomycetota bacterium]|nr:cytochrome c-type biogenesis protein CcmH [Actinomycetota bacterium]